MKVTVAQFGARMHYAVPRILEEAGRLERFFTDSYAGDKPLLRKLVARLPTHARPAALERWSGRCEPAIPNERIVSFDRLGWAAWWAHRRAGSTAQRRRVYADFGARFARAIIRHGIGEADSVYGFNSASLELLAWAKARGVRCIVEQTMAPLRWHDQIMREEVERWSDWQPGLDLPDRGTDALGEREEQEWHGADLILCGSKFVVDCIGECGGPVERCRVVPYGVDPARQMRPALEGRASGKLRVLFAGDVGLRKGAPYLLEALRRLGPNMVEARFAGWLSLDPAKLDPYRQVAAFLGPVPRPRMADLYRWADLFVLPTLCEGSATVVYEAIMAGVPVITTPNAGSLVQEGREGHIVPSRDVDAIAYWLERYASRPNDLLEMRRAAAERAQAFSLDAYASRLLGAIELLSVE